MLLVLVFKSVLKIGIFNFGYFQFQGACFSLALNGRRPNLVTGVIRASVSGVGRMRRLAEQRPIRYADCIG